MKKKFMLCVPVLALGLLTSGCGNTKVLECTMTDDSSNGMEMTQTVKATYKKDSLTKMDMTMKVTVDEEYEDYMDMLEASLTSEFENLEGKKGIKIDTNTKNNVLTFSLVADIDKMDEETKEELNMVEGTETYEEAKEGLEADGYTCK